MRRLLLTLGACALVSGFIATPSAFAQQSVNFFIGGFAPRAFDGRDCPNFDSGDCDVLVENTTFLSTFNRSNGIDLGRLNGATVGGDWLFDIGRFLEGGLGIGYYQRSMRTSYTDYVNQTDGSEIAQTLKLRIVPFTATVRLVPFGNDAPIKPYIGAGVAVFAWRYSESGQFIDFGTPDNQTFSGNFSGSGGAVGPVILGGVRVPIGPLGVGFELRHQNGVGTLPSDQGFAGTKIDLGGWNYLFTLNVPF